MPKISVLMPVYNTKEEYLRQAIESILCQTYSDFEFIIINDGSTNNAKDVILSYKDDRIRYFEQENKGIGATRNRSLKEAKGELCALMDSDDISLPNRLQIEAEYMDAHKDIDVLGSAFSYISDNTVVTHKRNPKYIDWLKETQLGNPTVMFRRESFLKYGLRCNEKISTSEDYEFYSRAARYLKFENLPDVLLNYRVLSSSNSHKYPGNLKQNDIIIRQNMLNFLTDDIMLQEKIKKLLFPQKEKRSLLKQIFSVRNKYKNGIKYKVLTIFGINIKFKVKQKNCLIIKLMGGLGNQMFQYAFGKALESKNSQNGAKRRVLFDNTWFDEIKDKNSNGVTLREYALGIFKPNITFSTKKQRKNCKKTDVTNIPFSFDSSLFKQNNAYIEGYFQNENYFSDIPEIIRKEFNFPKISETDEFNTNILKKIHSCKNPVFIHIRRGDYLNLKGWALSDKYYHNAVNYIKSHINSPTFFVFGQDCDDYIKNELKLDVPYELIGNTNSDNHEDWKDMFLMSQCKHGIIANSSFSWWAAWLCQNDDKIIVAPTPWLDNNDETICKNWVKIER
jgi:glycosyltransferase involved in cell wall biosynthesis